MPSNKVNRGKGKIGKITKFIEENHGNDVSDFDSGSGSDFDSSMDVSENEANTSDDDFIDVS